MERRMLKIEDFTDGKTIRQLELRQQAMYFNNNPWKNRLRISLSLFISCFILFSLFSVIFESFFKDHKFYFMGVLSILGVSTILFLFHILKRDKYEMTRYEDFLDKEERVWRKMLRSPIRWRRVARNT